MVGKIASVLIIALICVGLYVLGHFLYFSKPQSCMLVLGFLLFGFWLCGSFDIGLGPFTESTPVRLAVGSAFTFLMFYFFCWEPGGLTLFPMEHPLGFVIIFATGLPYLVRTGIDMF